MQDSTEHTHETVRIPLDHISVPAGRRKLNKKTVDDLVTSIPVDGLLQDIGVRADPAKPGHFVLVFGRHRLVACVALGWVDVTAKRLDMDADEADMALHAENLFRNELDKAEFYESVAAWAKHYKDRHPVVAGSTTPPPAAGQGNRKRAAEGDKPGRSDSDLPDATPPAAVDGEPTRGENPEATKAFARVLADTTNQCATQAKQTVRIATGLSDEQRAALLEKEVPAYQLDKIAKLPNPDDRQKAVNLIASGMEINTALAASTAPDNATIESVAMPNAPGFKAEEDMTCEEWLDHYCRDILGKLAYKAAFKADALLYRITTAARTEFRGKLKKPLAQSKAGIKGQLHYMMSRLVNLGHPKDWPVGARHGSHGQGGG
jgi:hypothetical protein